MLPQSNQPKNLMQSFYLPSDALHVIWSWLTNFSRLGVLGPITNFNILGQKNNRSSRSLERNVGKSRKV